MTTACIGFMVILCCGLSGNAIGQVQTESELRQDEALRAFLVGYVESKRPIANETRYERGFVDLNGDGVDEVVVYLEGRHWCGTGGCLLLVLTRTGDSYRLVAQVPATRPPIRALTEKSHGWRTLTMWVSGGGVYQGYEGAIPFNGVTYPVSGTRRRVTGTLEGEAVIPSGGRGLRLVAPGTR